MGESLEQQVQVSQSRKKLLILALSMAGTQLITVSGGFLCMVMLAHLGHQVLAASALMISTQISVIVVGMSILFSLSVLIGHAYGAKNFVAVGYYMRQGWTLAILISIPIILIFWNIAPILIFLGQSKPITLLVAEYFKGYVWAVIPILITICNQQLCFGIHQQKIVVTSSLLSVIVLLLTAYTLIFGKLGAPALGVVGQGYAMAAQAWFAFIFLGITLFRHKNFRVFEIFNFRAINDWSYLTRMFKVGWPISLQISGEMLSLLVVSMMVGWLGTNALAAYQVASQFMFVIVVPIFALSQAGGILIGQAAGSRQFGEINLLGKVAIQLGLTLSSIAALLFLLFPKMLASVYLDIHNPLNKETVHLIVLLFVIIAFSQLFDSLRNIITGLLRGLFDTRYPMFIGLFVLWVVGLPISYVLAFILKEGVVGIASGSLIAIMIGALLVWFRWCTITKSYRIKITSPLVSK